MGRAGADLVRLHRDLALGDAVHERPPPQAVDRARAAELPDHPASARADGRRGPGPAVAALPAAALLVRFPLRGRRGRGQWVQPVLPFHTRHLHARFWAELSGSTPILSDQAAERGRLDADLLVSVGDRAGDAVAG